jgi:hypothetical protein
MKCGECTLCCTLFSVKWLDKPVNTDCIHCVAKKGCSIQETKDVECIEYQCAYTQMEKVSEKLRPDNCGVVFEKLEDDLMFGTKSPKHKDFKFVQGQINAFLKEGINVVISKNGQPLVYHLDDAKPEELLKRVYKIKRNGSSSI